MKYIYAFAAFFLSSPWLFAQLTPVGYFYRTQWQLANPAAIDRILMSYHTTEHPDHHITFNARPQWHLNGVEGAPLTGFISYENAPNGSTYRLFRKYPVRWGFTIFGDKTDLLRRYGLYGNYSYELRFKDPHRSGLTRALRIGLSAGVMQQSVGNLRPRNPADPLIVRPPDVVVADVAFGLFYQRQKRHGNVSYWGLSLPGAYTGSISGNGRQYPFTQKFSRFYLMWGRYFASRTRALGRDEGGIEWEPTIWLRGTPRQDFYYYTLFKDGGLPLTLEATLRMYLATDYDKPARLWLGGGFGTNLVATAEGGMNFPVYRDGKGYRNLQIGLAYSMPVSKTLLQLGTTFECTASLSLRGNK